MGSETTFFSFCKRLHLSKLSSSVKDLAEDPEIIAALQSALTAPLMGLVFCSSDYLGSSEQG